MNEDLDDELNGQKAKEEWDKFLEEEFLKDIYFEIHQWTEFKLLLHKNIFNHNREDYTEIIVQIRINFERLKREYESKYGHKPDFELARKLFSSDGRFTAKTN